MARPKKQASAEAIAATNSDSANGEKPTQKEAVRRAMKVKGLGVSNTDLQSYIQEAFGMPLKLSNIATLKSQIRAERRRRVKGPEGYTLEDLRLIQELVRRIGAGRLRDMVDLFDK